MFEIMTFEDNVRVKPENIGIDKKEAIRLSLQDKFENKIVSEQAVVLAITEVLDAKGGMIEVEDAGIHYSAKFKAMVFVPKLHEVVEGTVVDMTEFGVFVRFGPIDGMCHISQIVNDFISYDKKSGILSGKDSKFTIKMGDVVRARIIGVSLDKREVNKINLTMRQPGLGPVAILKAEKEAKNKPQSKEDKPAKAEKPSKAKK